MTHPCNCKNCVADGCRYHPKNVPDDDDCHSVPYDTIFIWNFTKGYGCCQNPNYQELIKKNLTGFINRKIDDAEQIDKYHLIPNVEMVDNLKNVVLVINNWDFADLTER